MRIALTHHDYISVRMGNLLRQKNKKNVDVKLGPHDAFLE